MVSKKQTNEIAGAGASNRFVPDNAVASRGAIQDTSPEIVPIDDPVQLFKAAVDTGVVNTQAQIVNFKGSSSFTRTAKVSSDLLGLV